MSVETSLKIHLPAKSYIQNEEISLGGAGGIAYNIPSLEGLHHFRISLEDNYIDVNEKLKLKKVEGYVYQYDSEYRGLRYDYVTINRGSDITIPAESNVAQVVLGFAYTFIFIDNFTINPCAYISGSGNAILTIKCENENNDVLHMGIVRSSEVYGTMTFHENVIVSGENPVRIVPIICKNYDYLLVHWFYAIQVLEGDTTDSSLTIQQLDANDNVIYSWTLSPVSNFLRDMAYYDTISKFKVTLSTPRKLKVKVTLIEVRRGF